MQIHFLSDVLVAVRAVGISKSLIVMLDAARVVLNLVSLKTTCPLWRSVCCTGALCNLILQFYRGYVSISKGVRSIIRVHCSIIIRCYCNMPVQITTGFRPVRSHDKTSDLVPLLIFVLKCQLMSSVREGLGSNIHLLSSLF